ncbi:unnamed protein product [Anisakis simplex]|uniref:Elongation factor 1-alpha n=1 Tax=Anisakis simplex TaxID=6269 RepID=A0A0M3JLV4_ANISI|nr:unnamed protein product [Anisakis simplex]
MEHNAETTGMKQLLFAACEDLPCICGNTRKMKPSGKIFAKCRNMEHGLEIYSSAIAATMSTVPVMVLPGPGS